MDKKECLSLIGKTLVLEFGKQKFYTPEQVKIAHDKIKGNNPDYISTSADILEFAVSMYSPVDDFIVYFTSSASEYLRLKKEAINEISNSDWDILSDIDIDMSWLDAGDITDSVIEGIASFFTSIFD